MVHLSQVQVSTIHNYFSLPQQVKSFVAYLIILFSNYFNANLRRLYVYKLIKRCV